MTYTTTTNQSTNALAWKLVRTGEFALAIRTWNINLKTNKLSCKGRRLRDEIAEHNRRSEEHSRKIDHHVDFVVKTIISHQK